MENRSTATVFGVSESTVRVNIKNREKLKLSDECTYLLVQVKKRGVTVEMFRIPFVASRPTF